MALTNKQKIYKEYLTHNNFSVEFSDDGKKIIFICQEKHENILTMNSFTNLKSNFLSDNYSSLCKGCRKLHQQQKDTADLQKNSKHKIIFYHDKNTIDFECMTCKSIGVSTKLTLIKSSFCKKCSNSQTRKNYEELQKEISDLGFRIITIEKDYKDNKNIEVFCKCNSIWKCSLNDLKRGRLCSKCKINRTQSTNLLKYGCENVFQNESIKKKSVGTCLKNHGVKYPQQSPDVRLKTTQTSLELYGHIRAFCKPEVYIKIQDTCMKKYGVKYPLQSPIIQSKIDQTFLLLCGKTRPFGTYYHNQIILKKYGNTIFVCTDYCKDKMREKYGSEFFINSDECKKQMLEKYGCEYALQNNELFHKMLKSSFRRREYIFEDKSISLILGYEDLALKDLEECKLYKIIESGDSSNIPTFWYDDNGKKRKYYPDIYLPEINTIIEVKSTYYFEKDMKQNICKAKEVSKKYICLFYVYKDRRKSKTIYKLIDDKFVVENKALLE